MQKNKYGTVWRSIHRWNAFLFFLLTLLVSSCNEEAKKSEEVKTVSIVRNEFFFVVDTSGSMAKKAFPVVRDRFHEFLGIINEGDTVYLIGFDEKPVLVFQTDDFKSEQKEKLMEAFFSLKPVGMYTDLQEMLDYVKSLSLASKPEEVVEYPEKNEKHIIRKNQFIIVMSDGIDEPPKKRNKVNLKTYAIEEQLPVKDRYVYYISFSPRKSEIIESSLQEIASEVKVIERPVENSHGDTFNAESDVTAKNENNAANNSGEIADPSGILEVKEKILDKKKEIDEELKTTRDSKSYQDTVANYLKKAVEYGSRYIYHIIYVFAIFFLFYLLFYLLIKRWKTNLKGELLFYEAGSHPSMGKAVKLAKFERHTLTIGKNPECLVRIKSDDFPAKINLKPVEGESDYFFKVPKRYRGEIQFLNKKTNLHVIMPGDKFKIRNYIFEFSYGSRSKN